jgi:hypothetical protein
MGKEKKIREVYAEHFNKNANPLDLGKLEDLVKAKRITGGYVIKQGQLSNGNGFCAIYFEVKK